MKDSPELDFHLRCRALCEWCGWTLAESLMESPPIGRGMRIKDKTGAFFNLEQIELLEALMKRERAKELDRAKKFPGIARLNMDAIKPAIGVPTCQPTAPRPRTPETWCDIDPPLVR